MQHESGSAKRASESLRSSPSPSSSRSGEVPLALQCLSVSFSRCTQSYMHYGFVEIHRLFRSLLYARTHSALLPLPVLLLVL